MTNDPAFESHLAEQRFQMLVSAVTDYALYMLDPEGRIVTWNPGAQRFKGYVETEIVGQNFSRFFTPEDQAADLPARALRVAAREGRYEAEGWRVRKDGTRFWANAVLDPIRGPSGELLGFAKITRDVTAKREAEQALFQSEQRFRMLVEGVRDYAIYMLDTEGRISNWNSGAEVIKGYSAAEIVGKHFSIFYTEEDRARDEPGNALRTALREGKYEREAQRVRKDGSLFWASVVIDPIYDEAGTHVGFAKITRDVTERKRADDELEEARQATVQAQKLQALGELTGGIAHDFNNLMTVVAGSTELLLRRPDLPDNKRKRYLEAIAQTAQRATTLTSQLLAFSRRQAVRPEVLDLNVSLDAIGEMLVRTLGSRIDVQLKLSGSLWRVEVDPAEFETALINLAFNARDAMPDGGRLTISTHNVTDGDGEMVAIDIGDTGEGMPRDVLDRAFEPFFTTKEIGRGTGLGLSQVHGFAAQAGGRAEIRSKTGHGTTVRILLPRSRKEPSAETEAGVIPVLPEGLRVLLVEDNDQVLEFAEHLLTDLHCDVVSASSGDQALALLEKHEVDLVFSDVVMPGMSGVDLAKVVRERFPDTLVLLASGYSDEVISGSAASFAMVRKPYGAEQISAAIGAILQADQGAAA